MMTDYISTSQGSISFLHRFPGVSQDDTFPNLKRKTLDRCCVRLAASGLEGSDLAIEYLYGKYIKNLSIHTIRMSGCIVLSFLQFLDKNSSDIYHLTPQDIGSYVDYQQSRGLKTQSLVCELRLIYAFVAFLIEQGILPYTLTQHKIKLKLPEALPRAMPHEDVKLLLSVLNDIRSRALILLLLRTGMRVGELLEVKLPDIVFPERKILLYLGEKNFQGRVVYYSKDAADALQLWLQYRDKSSEYLFPGKECSPISYATSRRILHKPLRRAGLMGKGYTLHSLRHTVATDMLNAGMRIEVLQQLLGHYEIAMTMRYARLVDRTREQEYFKAMNHIEHGRHHESHNINTRLQKVFEKKKLLRTNHKKLPE